MSQPLCGAKLKAQKSWLSQSINDIEIESEGKEFHLVEDNDFGLTDDIHGRQIIKMQEAIIFVQKIRVMQWVLIDVVDLVEQWLYLGRDFDEIHWLVCLFGLKKLLCGLINGAILYFC